MIEFAWPLIFLLLPLPAVVMYLQSQKPTSGSILIPPSVATALKEIEQQKRKAGLDLHTLRLLLLGLSWLTLLIAIAQPFKPETGEATPASGRAISLLIDLSTSMERRDFSIKNEALEDETVDRLVVVKKIASQFIAEREGDRVGLVLFGSEAFVASPLTYDIGSVNAVLQSSGIGMAGRTTAMGDALGLAIKSLRDDPTSEKAIVLLSDGTSNAGTAEPEDAARLAQSLGITVHTIGLGSDDSVSEGQQFQSASADLDEETLKAIAAASGGEFFRAHTSAELQSIYSEIDSLESADAVAPPLIVRRDYRNIFIVLSLVFLLLALATEYWPFGISRKSANRSASRTNGRTAHRSAGTTARATTSGSTTT